MSLSGVGSIARRCVLLSVSASLLVGGMASQPSLAAAAKHHPLTRVHGGWSDPVGACVAHIVSFDAATGAVTCTGTSKWTGTWVGSTTWTLTGRQDPATGVLTGQIHEVFKGHAARGRHGTLTFVEQITVDAAGKTDIRGHIVRGSGGLAGAHGDAHWIGQSGTDGSGSGTYSGRWRAGK
jgi:hypothetical protein